MEKKGIALITGATDGIGYATALELAQSGFTIHVLGINKERGEATINELNRIYPNGNHQLFIVDLSKMAEVKNFLNTYKSSYNQLDILILNAGIFPKKQLISEDQIDMSFSIGYVSRYLFSIELNDLLLKSRFSKVLHINGSVIGKIRYDKLHNPTYSRIRSVWQNSLGSALLVNNWEKISKSKVSHYHWNPGIVNTQTVKSQGAIIRFISKLMGMKEAEEVGKMISNFILSVRKNESKFYQSGKVKNVKVKDNEKKLKELLVFSKEFTGIDFN